MHPSPQPYLFVLREGKAIKSDFLDYSLILMKMSDADALLSPDAPLQPPYLPIGQVIPQKR